ncbi:MAG: hypothetical protein ACE5Q6_18410 [Dehalococcoidia bacterium]
MSVSGFLVPFPDPGAADLMSDHLEQEVHANGPGKILLTVTLPRTLSEEPKAPSGSGSAFARKKLEFLQRQGEDWVVLWSAITDSEQASEKVSLEVFSPGRLKCRVTNMSGIEGQFSLDCKFIPQQ